MTEAEAAMQAAALAWADDALTRFAPERMSTWQHLAWRMFRPALREFVAAGYAGGYSAAQDDMAGAKR